MSGEQLPESTAHILIVDDLPDHLAFAGTILRQQGYRVHAATSGRAALAFLEKRLPDLTQAAVIMSQAVCTRRVSCTYFGASAHCAAEQGALYGI